MTGTTFSRFMQDQRKAEAQFKAMCENSKPAPASKSKLQKALDEAQR